MCLVLMSRDRVDRKRERKKRRQKKCFFSESCVLSVFFVLVRVGENHVNVCFQIVRFPLVLTEDEEPNMATLPVLVLQDKVALNAGVVLRVRTTTSLVAGVAAGVLGITGWFGAVFFLLHAIATSLAMNHFSCAGSPQAYFVGGAKELTSISNLLTGVLTYILIWTIVYDSIYIF